MGRGEDMNKSKAKPEKTEIARGAESGAEEARAKEEVEDSGKKYEAMGDEPLAIASGLKLQETFRVDRGLAKRLRWREINAKEAFTIRDASGEYLRASLLEYDERGAMALAYERMERSPESGIDITLACAVLARQRMHFVMQKATELGVRRIVPMITEHSVKAEGLAQEQAHAWAGHIARAARQCRRSSLPALVGVMSLDDFLASKIFAGAERCLYLDDRSDAKSMDGERVKKIVLIVGPEGGFSETERAKLESKARAWVLGGRILRAETAVVAGLTAVQVRWGDFGFGPKR
jgi:16S rRNA (uracil1498-N3)-methyltransferase